MHVSLLLNLQVASVLDSKKCTGLNGNKANDCCLECHADMRALHLHDVYTVRPEYHCIQTNGLATHDQ